MDKSYEWSPGQDLVSESLESLSEYELALLVVAQIQIVEQIQVVVHMQAVEQILRVELQLAAVGSKMAVVRLEDQDTQ
jgi:hypothetical protein